MKCLVRVWPKRKKCNISADWSLLLSVICNRGWKWKLCLIVLIIFLIRVGVFGMRLVTGMTWARLLQCSGRRNYRLCICMRLSLVSPVVSVGLMLCRAVSGVLFGLALGVGPVGAVSSC